MSTPEYPKQFIDVMGVGKSLIQLTVERFKDICPKENFWVVTSEKYVDIVKEQLPQIAGVMNELEPALLTDREAEKLKRLFPTCEKISIDYAVMEKAEDIFVLPAEFGWSDLGSWGSLHTLLPQDENGNASVGTNVKLFDCRNCVVHVADERKVVLEGLDGYIVAEKNGQLLICRLSEEQRIKEFSAGK